MYGTIMRARLKGGTREQFEAAMAGWNQRMAPDGFHSTEIAFEDNDPDRVVVIVHFRDKDSYRANAESPAQDAEYRELVALLEGEPEWIDVNYGTYLGQPLPE